MIALLQRVKEARCTVNKETIASIRQGMVVYVGMEQADTASLIPKMAEKIAHARIFEDAQGKMNLSASDKGHEILLIPNFTLAGILDSRRPSFSEAKDRGEAQSMFESLYEAISKHLTCKKGVFGASMEISAIADGPVNLIVRVESRK